MVYKPKRFYRNKKRKWRQQKLSIGTIEKISKRIALHQIQKQEEPKFTLLTIGAFAATGPPIGNIIARDGQYNGLTGIYLNNDYFAPHTVKTIVSPANPIEVPTGRGTRLGDSVELVGIALRGTLVYPSQMDTGCRVRMTIFKADGPQGKNLNEYQTCIDLDDNSRMINDSEEISKVKEKHWLLNHKTGSQTSKYNVNMYVRFKKPKRIRYNETVVNPAACSLLDFQDTKYRLSLTSDVPPQAFVSPVPAAVRNQYPQFYGQWTCYYRDS